MPTFTAIILDRLLEPGASKSDDKSVPFSNPIPKPKSLPKARPVPNTNLERSNSTSAVQRKVSHPQISPALYATPESTPLPDSPSSFSPSPYIINHKRRGPRLLKSHSEVDVASHSKNVDEDKVNGSAKDAEKKVDTTKESSVTFVIPNSAEERNVNLVPNNPTKEEIANGAHWASIEEEHMNCHHNGEVGSSNGELKSRNVRNVLFMDNSVLKPISSNSERDSELEDFFDPQESMSYTSNTDGEDNSVMESSVKLAATTPVGEFYDAWEELSSESGPQSFLCDVEAELREMRFNLLMEIERRKQAEETLYNLRDQWQRIREQLALVGLTLPAFPMAVQESVLSPDSDPAEEICQQVYLARFVSNSIGRGIAKAEAEMEKDIQIENKNFEIARLTDRLHYYEAVNREMSQRNQEAVEMARRNRQVRKRRQRWVWGSIATVITLGAAALAWSYIPASTGSSSTNDRPTPEHDEAAD